MSGGSSAPTAFTSRSATLKDIINVCQQYETRGALIEQHSPARQLLFELSRAVQRLANDVIDHESADCARIAHLERVVAHHELLSDSRSQVSKPAESYGYVAAAREEVARLRRDNNDLAAENKRLQQELNQARRGIAGNGVTLKMEELAQGRPTRGTILLPKK